MKKIKLEGGVRVRAFSPPPKGFDPLTASPPQLLKHGFPARPDYPPLLMRYKQAFGQMAKRFHYIQPEFQLNKRRRRRLPAPPTVGIGNEIHQLWSGGGVFPPMGQSFRWITGEWTIPNLGAPTQNQEYFFTSWIGIDGDQFVPSTDLCQVGINLDVTQNGNSFSRDIAPFCEWVPGPEVGIPNFPVSPGDTVAVTLCTAGPGSTEATVFLANITSGHGTSFVFDAPPGVSLSGDSAQWVVERPEIGPNLTPALLADYGQVFFSGCQAASFSPDGSSITVVHGGSQFRIDMVEQSTFLSRGTLVADEVIQCTFVAPGTGLF